MVSLTHTRFIVYDYIAINIIIIKELREKQCQWGDENTNAFGTAVTAN